MLKRWIDSCSNLTRPAVLTRSLVAGVFVCMAGCGEMKVAPVTGIVTLDGEPLKRASVMFEPEAGGRPSFGLTDENGRYRLAYSMNEEGAEVGTCRVKISTAVEQGDYGSKRSKELVPPRYRQEPIQVEVQSRSNTIDIELTN